MIFGKGIFYSHPRDRLMSVYIGTKARRSLDSKSMVTYEGIGNIFGALFVAPGDFPSPNFLMVVLVKVYGSATQSRPRRRRQPPQNGEDVYRHPLAHRGVCLGPSDRAAAPAMEAPDAPSVRPSSGRIKEHLHR